MRGIIARIRAWYDARTGSIRVRPAEVRASSMREEPRAPATGSGPPPPARRASDAHDDDELGNDVTPIGGVGNLDRAVRPRSDGGDALLARVRARVESGRFELPQLPGTTLNILSMARDASADISELTDRIASDPVLSSDLVKLGSSALYGPNPVGTIREAVMRVGLRGLRSVILAASMRGAILRDRRIQGFGEEVWRQSFSVASIARVVGQAMGRDADEAFLLGLLHDIGKVCLLQILSEEMRSTDELAAHVVGRVFLELHEEAGARMAEAWQLSEELVSVAGCHHDFEANEEYAQSAALVRLAHRMDLYLSLGAGVDFRRLRTGKEMRFLGITDDEESADLFHEVHDVFIATHAERATKAGAA